jgi:hypothetical protein
MSCVNASSAARSSASIASICRRSAILPNATWPRLVLDDQVEDAVEQGTRARAAHVEEGRQRDAFDDDLHADQLREPQRMRDDLVEHPAERRRRRMDLADPVDVTREHVEMPCLVVGLRGRRLLHLDARQQADQVGRDHQRALLAVEQLAERDRSHARRQPVVLCRRQLRDQARGQQRPADRAPCAHRIDRRVPVERFRGGPLILDRFVVEAANPRLGSVIIPAPAERDYWRRGVIQLKSP